MNDYNYQSEAPYQEQEENKPSALAVANRNFGISSFLISVLVHVLFFLLAMFFLYRWIEPTPEPAPDFVPGGGGGGGSGGETAHKIKSSMRRSVSTAVTNKRITSTSSNSSFSLPDTSDFADSAMPMDVTSSSGAGGGAGGGRGTGVGTGVGGSTGPGKGFGQGQLGIGALIPSIIKGRCTDRERNKMLSEAGGVPAIEESVKKSLAWLKGQQKADGSWGTDYNVGMTGLVLLCYLGHCESTESVEYGENVSKGITFLINNSIKNKGMLATSLAPIGWAYEHAIATYALSESLTFSKNLTFKIPGLEDAVKNAATVIIDGQNKNGSWDYHYKLTNRNDLSVMGWQMQALKAAKASGVKLDKLDSCVRTATRCLEALTGEGGVYIGDGAFAYAGGGDKNKPAMTPVAVLCMQQWGGEKARECKDGIKYMLDGLEEREMPKEKHKTTGKPQSIFQFTYNSNCDLYALYYASQCFRNEGGKGWDLMNKAIIEEIVPNQQSNGAFNMEGGGDAKYVHNTNGARGSRQIYVQCLDTLILEVYYRFLPATSSGKSGNGGFKGLDDIK